MWQFSSRNGSRTSWKRIWSWTNLLSLKSWIIPRTTYYWNLLRNPYLPWYRRMRSNWRRRRATRPQYFKRRLRWSQHESLTINYLSSTTRQSFHTWDRNRERWWWRWNWGGRRRFKGYWWECTNKVAPFLTVRKEEKLTQ